MMTKEGYLKHKELIEAWANGVEIEYWDELMKIWKSIENPSWCVDIKYRIKPSKYELKGGYWSVHGPLKILYVDTNTEYLKAGLERKTEVEAKDLVNLLKRTARLHALACELGGLKKFDKKDLNWVVIKDGDTWTKTSFIHYEPEKVYMTKECAEKICEMLNNKEFDLEGEENE